MQETTLRTTFVSEAWIDFLNQSFSSAQSIDCILDILDIITNILLNTKNSQSVTDWEALELGTFDLDYCTILDEISENEEDVKLLNTILYKIVQLENFENFDHLDIFIRTTDSSISLHHSCKKMMQLSTLCLFCTCSRME